MKIQNSLFYSVQTAFHTAAHRLVFWKSVYLIKPQTPSPLPTPPPPIPTPPPKTENFKQTLWRQIAWEVSGFWEFFVSFIEQFQLQVPFPFSYHLLHYGTSLLQHALIPQIDYNYSPRQNLKRQFVVL